MKVPGSRRGAEVTKRRTLWQWVSLVAANLYALPVLKHLPYPFLHCYACPLAIGACPVGTVQYFLALGRVPLFTLGTLGAIGAWWGRRTCGWLCPFGFLQELGHRLGRRLHLPVLRVSNRHAWTRWAVAAVLVVALPLAVREPWFCKLCPAGTLEGGIPWLAIDPGLRQMAGVLFGIKVAILLGLVAAVLVVKRPFCRFVCPLGLFYGLTNRFSRQHLQVGPRCTGCGWCRDLCPMDHEVWRDPRSSQCILCLECTRCRHVRLAHHGTETGTPSAPGHLLTGPSRPGEHEAPGPSRTMR